MTPLAFNSLKEIGTQLDSDIYPIVYDGGFVMPCEADVFETQGEVIHDEGQRKSRSTTGPWQGTTRRKGPSGETPPLLRTYLETRYAVELNAVHEAYPKTQVWKQPDGLVLLTESQLLAGLDRKAVFLVAIPYAVNVVVKGWGFWGTSILGVEWVGPRHTNFPDGSICAFEPADGTWKPGGSLVELFDLYSVWALRHLHLAIFGRWPGYQAVHFPYERLIELRADEYCGCGQSDTLYGDCCWEEDRARNAVADAVEFTLRAQGGHRNPPAAVSEFVLTRSDPPQINELLLV